MSTWSTQKNQGKIIGAMTYETTPELWKQISQWQPKEKRYQVNLEEVTQADSAGMVLLIHLIEHAKKRNCHIMLSFLPEQLGTLFKLSNVNALLAEHSSTK